MNGRDEGVAVFAAENILPTIRAAKWMLRINIFKRIYS
ncbi:hypothetical protein PMI22_03699 [Pseudomonas sp. GM21]|nr:hypothetical protein PMI22_03699 [Pseudomonas sp. GM21]